MWKLNTGLPDDLEGIIYCFLEDPVQTLVVQELEDISKFMDYYPSGSFADRYFTNIPFMDEILRVKWEEECHRSVAEDIVSQMITEYVNENRHLYHDLYENPVWHSAWPTSQ